MLRLEHTRARARLALLALSVLTFIPTFASAQTGSAVGVSVSTATIQQTIAAATLPSTGFAVSDQDATSLAVLTSGLAAAVTTGGSSPSGENAQSIASVADVQVLGGVVRAARVIALASASSHGSQVTTTGAGSVLEGLVVNGVAVETPAPNTRIDIPGTGYVMLNEQGATAQGITVTMIRVVLTAPITGIPVGEIVVSSATSRVN